MNDIERALKDMGIGEKYDNEGSLAEKLGRQQQTDVSGKNIIRKDITTDAREIKILPISDIHLGMKLCNEEAFIEFIKFIDDNPDTYVILMGDLAESATKTSIGMGTLDEKFHVGVQRRVLHDLLKPIASQGKILGGLTGNHEMRVQYFNDTNPMADLCYELEVPYMGFQGYFTLCFNDEVTYNIMAYHGASSSQTKGGKINAAVKPNQIANADLYLTGHTHDQIITKDIIYEFDNENDELVPKHRYYAVCGSFLEYFGGYAEMKGLAPSPIGAPTINLSTDRQYIYASM